MGGGEVESSESMYATTHVSSDTACWRHWEWSISCICTYSLIYQLVYHAKDNCQQNAQ
jgi:hypothetical protein